MNILILAAGDGSSHNPSGDNYPLCLTEFNGIPLIEKIIKACDLFSEKQIIVALNDHEIRQHHIDNIIRLLESNSKTIRVRGETKGAACTALLAEEYINSNAPLLILNGNEYVDVDYSKLVSFFESSELDVGVATFPSVHPRYSYIRLDESNLVTECAEKNPISRNAVIGFYWFRQGSSFIEAAKNMIRKDVTINGKYFITPALNELILKRSRIGTFSIDASKYYPLKTERQISQFESFVEQESFCVQR